MAPAFADDTVSRVRNAADIVEVVSDYVVLKKAGANYKGLCPFHPDKDPSFSVNPDKKFFHCFGCNTGGDVFDFVMRHDNLTFPEALEALARRYGIQVTPRDMDPEEKKRVREKKELFSILAAARDFFRAQLRQGMEGDQARAYMKTRGLPEDLMEEFGLGFAPDGWQNLADHLQKKRIPPEKAEAAGLLAKRKSGTGYYDRFRNRIMFPITDLSGQTVGFGGRVFAPEDQREAKYINTPQTAIYNKQRVLYGGYAARQACRNAGAIFVVEGYFDVLSLRAQGITHVAATCGTALTKEHARLLKGLSPNVILVFDGDDAGQKAARRGLSVLLAENIAARVCVLPKGHDPDTFVKEKGAQAFLDLAGESRELVPFLIESAIAEHGLSIAGKSRIVGDLAETIAAVADPVARSEYVRRIADRLDVNEAAVLEHVREAAQPKRGPILPAQPAPAARELVFEKKILQLMLCSRELCLKVSEKGFISHFGDPDFQAIARVLENRAAQEQPEPDVLSLFQDQRHREIVARMLDAQSLEDVDQYQRLLDQFEAMLQRKERRDCQRVNQELQDRGDDEKVLVSVAERQEKRRAEIQRQKTAKKRLCLS